jgi:hypothetical protein
MVVVRHEAAMHRKLTLRLDDALIETAKRASRKAGKSVSQMVADYFALIERGFDSDRKLITRRAKSLFGALAGSRLTENDYRRHIEAKHR